MGVLAVAAWTEAGALRAWGTSQERTTGNGCGGVGSSRVTAQEPGTGSAKVLTTGTGGSDDGVTIRIGPGVPAALLRRSSIRTRGRDIVQNGERRGDSRAERRSPFDLWEMFNTPCIELQISTSYTAEPASAQTTGRPLCVRTS